MRGDRLEEPDVDDRRGQVDVAHALATDTAVRDLDAATVADDAFELGAFVLTAGTLVVAFWAEDAFTEQTVLFRAVGSIVDGLGFLNFAERPRTDVVRGGEVDFYRGVVVNAVVELFRHIF